MRLFKSLQITKNALEQKCTSSFRTEVHATVFSVARGSIQENL